MSSQGFFGTRGLPDGSSEYNLLRFLIRQELALVRTGIPVKVIAVHGGGLGPAPTVDVQPLVNQIDGQGNQTPHEVVYGIPVARVQGGGNAIINDPKVGDVGHMVCSDRDTSSLRANEGAQSNPGSFRRHSMADGVYHGAMLNPATPDQGIQWTDTGFRVFDKNGNVMEMTSGSVTITTDELRVTGAIVAGYGGTDAVNVQTHVHSGITPGGADTDAPVPGS